MLPTKIEVVGQPYSFKQKQLDAQTCINLYQLADQTGKNSVALLGCPGTILLLDLDIPHPNSPTRGYFQLNDKLYVVFGKFVYEFSSFSSYKKIGEIKTNSGIVIFTSNDTQIGLSDNIGIYIYQYEDTDTHKKGDFFLQETTETNIDDPVFDGAGLDDLTVSGIYTGNSDRTYKIEIDKTATTPNVDEFRWSDTDGDTWNEENVEISGNIQALSFGVSIQFANQNGHTKNDDWTIKSVTDRNLFIPSFLTSQQGFGILGRINSKRFYITQIGDLSKINALDFAQKNSKSDNIVTGISINDELWLLGNQTTEVWYLTGNADFPYQPRPNYLVNYGCLVARTLIVISNNILLWLGRNSHGDRRILLLENYAISEISTEPMNDKFRDYFIDDAYGFLITWNGHDWAVFTFPTEGKTWIWDLSTKMWHERKTRYLLDGKAADSAYKDGHWFPTFATYFDGKWIVGDNEKAQLYELTDSIFEDHGTLMIAERTLPHLSVNEAHRTIGSIQIDGVRGEPLKLEGKDSDPQYMLQLSRNGAKTWKNEIWKSSGKTGDYAIRIKWNRLGTTRNLAVRLKISDRSLRGIFSIILKSVVEAD